MSLVSALSEVANGSGELPWQACLALLLSADADPAVWDEAWQELSPDAREGLLTRLAVQTGPLADLLVQVLAERVRVEPDPQLRETVYLDAARAADRTLAQLRTLRDRRAAEASAIAGDHLDLVAEIVQLESERDRRLAELAGDPGHQRRTELEREIERLKELQTLLRSYDWPAREAELAELDADTTEHKAARDAFEMRMREAQEQNLATRESVKERESQLIEQEAILEQNRQRNLRLASALDQARSKAQNLQLALNEHQLQLDRVLAEIERLEGEIAARQELLASEVERRGELQRRVDSLSPEWSRLSKELTQLVQRHDEACGAAEDYLRQVGEQRDQLWAHLGELVDPGRANWGRGRQALATQPSESVVELAVPETTPSEARSDQHSRGGLFGLFRGNQ